MYYIRTVRLIVKVFLLLVGNTDNGSCDLGFNNTTFNTLYVYTFVCKSCYITDSLIRNLNLVPVTAQVR